MNNRWRHVRNWKAVAIKCNSQFDAIANECGVSGRILRRHFQKALTNPKTWVDALWASLAAAQLLKGVPMKTTAAAFSFTRASQFSRFFKRMKGSAPTNFAGSRVRSLSLPP
jgi:methylphosphotriester-DNA--protein-cysteine methyltransferase